MSREFHDRSKTPFFMLESLKHSISSLEEVSEKYEPSKERLREVNYHWDCIISRLSKTKGSF